MGSPTQYLQLSLLPHQCDDDVLAYLLGHLCAPLSVRRVLFVSTLLSASDAKFVWPEQNEIARAQDVVFFLRSKHLIHIDNLWCNTNEVV